MAALTVVVAPDSFKGTVAADVAANALADGWRSVRPGDTIVPKPMADGGEGTVDAFALAVPGARRMPVSVTGPDDRTVRTDWLLLPDGTGVVELAGASGITLLDPLLPLGAHSVGFGEVIAAALDSGVSRLLLAIGGSASTDGGTGALTALGARFLDAGGEPIPRGGAGLARLDSCDFRGLRALPTAGASVLSDVTSPLLGPLGAASVFGPQKGASAEQIARLEEGLRGLARLVEGVKHDAPGAGAAGGVGFGLLAWGAVMAGGATAVASALGIPEAVSRADLVVTGEGSYDEQSAAGKVPSHIADLADAAGAPVALVAGRIQASTDRFASALSLAELAGSVDAAQTDAVRYLGEAGARLARAAGPVGP